MRQRVGGGPTGGPFAGMRIELTAPQRDELVAAAAYWETVLEDNGDARRLALLRRAVNALTRR